MIGWIRMVFLKGGRAFPACGDVQMGPEMVSLKEGPAFIWILGWFDALVLVDRLWF
jgi:hypothetical protein